MGRRSVPNGDHGDSSSAVSVVAVKRPVAGVRFGDDDLIPPDTLRRCKICQQPIEHLDIRRVCCGHPKCQRANRNNKRLRKKPGQLPAPRSWKEHYERRHQSEQDAVERKVLLGYRYATARGADKTTALTWISRNVEIPVNQVMEILGRKLNDEDS